jgi:hypothetical protein
MATVVLNENTADELRAAAAASGMAVDSFAIIITDHFGDSYWEPAHTFAAWVKTQAFVDFYDAATVKHDNVMQPLDWAVSTLLQAPIRRYSPLEKLAENSSRKWSDCNRALVLCQTLIFG